MDLCRRRKSHRHHLTRFNRPSKSAHPSAMGGEATSTRLPSARILSAFCSLIPLIVHNVFLGVNATASTVWKPASESFFVSCADIPTSYSQRKSHFFSFSGNQKENILDGWQTYLEFGHQERSQRFEIFLLGLFALLVDKWVLLLFS